ncbi:MAG: hypothetical protein ACOC79_00215 [Thermodesulfobacteriota bacterium]
MQCFHKGAEARQGPGVKIDMGEGGKKKAGKELLEQSVSLPVCYGKMKVPTDKETEALKALRSIKDQVRTLKRRQEALKGQDRETDRDAAAIEAELARLKRDWDTWEQKRAEAEKERMILLGHEENH